MAIRASGAPGRNRTCDHWIRSPLLYPLSYGGTQPEQPDIAGRTHGRIFRRTSRHGMGCRRTPGGVPHLCPSVGVAQSVRAPGCGPGGRGFETPRSPPSSRDPSGGGRGSQTSARPGEVRRVSAAQSGRTVLVTGASSGIGAAAGPRARRPGRHRGAGGPAGRSARRGAGRLPSPPRRPPSAGRPTCRTPRRPRTWPCRSGTPTAASTWSSTTPPSRCAGT